MGRYDGEEYVYKNRCSPKAHRWAMNGTCWDCGVSKKYLVDEAKLVLELDAKHELGRREG